MSEVQMNEVQMSEVRRRWHLGFPQAAWGGVGVGEHERSVVWCHPCPPSEGGQKRGHCLCIFLLQGYRSAILLKRFPSGN